MQNTVSDYPEMVFRVKEHENVTVSVIQKCSAGEKEPVCLCPRMCVYEREKGYCIAYMAYINSIYIEIEI